MPSWHANAGSFDQLSDMLLIGLEKGIIQVELLRLLLTAVRDASNRLQTLPESAQSAGVIPIMDDYTVFSLTRVDGFPLSRE